MVDRRRQVWLNKSVNRLLTPVLRFRKGKLSFKGAPLGILHTTGAKSGKPRETPLLCLPLDEGSFALVGSNGGDDRTPAWVHNLQTHPNVELEIGGGRRQMTATIADADQRAELWPRLVTMYKQYESYQRKTTREIPVIVLAPRSS